MKYILYKLKKKTKKKLYSPFLFLVFQVDEGYPRKVSTWWLGCNDDTQNQMHHNVHSVITARPNIPHQPRTWEPPRSSKEEKENFPTTFNIAPNEAYRTNSRITLFLTTFFTIVFILRQ